MAGNSINYFYPSGGSRARIIRLGYEVIWFPWRILNRRTCPSSEGKKRTEDKKGGRKEERERRRCIKARRRRRSVLDFDPANNS